MVLFVSKEPKYHMLVLPFPITLSDTKVFPLLREVQWPKAPFIETYLEQ